MGKRKRRKFTAEYKAEVAKLVNSSGKSVGQVAKELDSSSSTSSAGRDRNPAVVHVVAEGRQVAARVQHGGAEAVGVEGVLLDHVVRRGRGRVVFTDEPTPELHDALVEQDADELGLHVRGDLGPRVSPSC